MTPHELLLHFEQALHDDEHAERLLDVVEWMEHMMQELRGTCAPSSAGLVGDAMRRASGISASVKAIADAAALAAYSHDRYLRAAAAYLRSGTDHPDLREFRARRGRLGGYARTLYALQKRTYDELMVVLLAILPGAAHELLTPQLRDALWLRFKEVERRALSRARARKLASGTERTASVRSR